MSDDSKVWLTDTVKSLGIPTVFLGIVLLMVWRAGAYVSSEVVMPLFQRQMVFIDTATKTLTETQLTASEIHTGQSRGFDDLDQLVESMEQISADTKRLVDMVKDVQSMIIEGQAKKE